MVKAICSVDGCIREVLARAMCSLHYQRWWKSTDKSQRTAPLNPRPPVVPAEVRFWAKVNLAGPDECWVWMASTGHFGYGVFRVRPGESMRWAHRVSWEMANGSIPEGMCVLHHCDNPPCVNPAHLWLGTKRDNNLDRAAKGRSNRDMSAATAASVAARRRRMVART